jgi:hypothetical protein
LSSISSINGETVGLPFAIIVNQKSTLFALLDFDDLICDAPVGLTVYGLSRFFARSSAQTKDRALGFVEPVMQKLHPVLALNRKVLLVALCGPCGRQSFHTSVNVHIKWHLAIFLSC